MRLLEKAGSGQLDTEWGGLARLLIDEVFDSDRVSQLDRYADVARALRTHWGVPCVEVESDIGGIGPLKSRGRELGRFSIRMPGLMDATRAYIALDGRIAKPEASLALLHELGHLVLHFQLLQSVGVVYHRICIDPSLEHEIGHFVTSDAGTRLRLLQEVEADIFALTWELPLWLDRDEAVAADAAKLASGLTVDGYRYLRARALLEGREVPPIAPAKVPSLNDRGEEARRRCDTADYPAQSGLSSRVFWALFNRSRLLPAIREEKGDAIRAYFDVAGPPRYVPELTHVRKLRPQADVAHGWIPRVCPGELERAVEDDRWEPFLVPTGSDEGAVPFHIPITPVPSVDPRDREREWRHMMKAAHDQTHGLAQWLERAESQGAGLLVFARTPAEKELDRLEEIR